MMRPWKSNFTRFELNCAKALCVLIVIVFLSPHIYFHFFYEEEQVDFSEFEAQVEAFYEQYDPPKMKYYYKSNAQKWENHRDEEEDWQDRKNIKSYKYERKAEYEKTAARLFSFDPNTVSFKELTMLGLSKKTANTLINFREKGGKFYKKTDLKKVYGLNKKDYERLKDYVKIVPQEKEEKMDEIVQEEVLSNEVALIIRLFPFDPNTATFDEFVTLGLSKKTAHTIINFREKGGKFYNKQDLQKIYTLQPTDYARLEPYIHISPIEIKEVLASEPTIVAEKSPSPKPTPVNVNINTATPDEWQKLYGIGPTYAKRIVKYREALGGFYAVSQVAETYGIADSAFQSILPQLKLDVAAIRTININTANKDDLAAHPYISWKKAKVIVAYREEHGAFESLQDVRKVRAISDELFEQLKAYLRVKE